MKYDGQEMDKAKSGLQASKEAKAAAESDLAMTEKDLKASTPKKTSKVTRYATTFNPKAGLGLQR